MTQILFMKFLYGGRSNLPPPKQKDRLSSLSAAVKIGLILQGQNVLSIFSILNSISMLWAMLNHTSNQSCKLLMMKLKIPKLNPIFRNFYIAGLQEVACKNIPISRKYD